MEKINQNPENKVSKLEQEKGELAVVPIFRANDLYQAMFPEVEPLFPKGKEIGYDEIKPLLNAIAKNKDKSVILDNTCREEILPETRLEDLPEEFGLKELPKGFDSYVLGDLFKKHFNIDLKLDDTIDSKIREQLNFKFSPELTKELLEIVKSKNPNVKQVYILNNSIGDHAGDMSAYAPEYINSAKEIGASIVSEESFEERREHESLVLAILKKAVKEEFGVEPAIVSTLHQGDIKDGDLVIVDRHNSLVSDEKLNEVLPKQVALLPIETELHNNEQFLGGEVSSEGLANRLRKGFEKTTN